MSGPVDSGWYEKRTAPGIDIDLHCRTIGDFDLVVSMTSRGWDWSVEWGDNTIADGSEWTTADDNDQPDAWAYMLPRVKAACEDAAREAGITVPS